MQAIIRKSFFFKFILNQNHIQNTQWNISLSAKITKTKSTVFYGPTEVIIDHGWLARIQNTSEDYKLSHPTKKNQE